MMENADIVVEHLDGSASFEQWDPRPHLNIRKKTIGDGFIELEIEPAGDMGDGRQRPHRVRLSDSYVRQFTSVEWAARVAMLEAVRGDLAKGGVP